MKSKRTIRVGLCFVYLLASVAASALSTDKEQPIEIEADFAEIDDRAGVAIYKGDVVATQGSIRLTGDTLTIRFTDDDELNEVLLEGEPARFRQRPDDRDVDTIGEARRIEYHSLDESLLLIENAKVTQGGKLFLGHRIDYDTKRNVLRARKADQGETMPSGEQVAPDAGRIRMILPPEKKQEER